MNAAASAAYWKKQERLDSHRSIPLQPSVRGSRGGPFYRHPCLQTGNADRDWTRERYPFNISENAAMSTNRI